MPSLATTTATQGNENCCGRCFIYPHKIYIAKSGYYSRFAGYFHEYTTVPEKRRVYDDL